MKLCPTCHYCYEDKDTSCAHKDHDPIVYWRAGTRLIDGRYRLDCLLGRGGMGAVYKCTHIELNRPRAIKLLRTDSADADPHGRMRLRREALTACCFDHPNVVRIYDFGNNVVNLNDDSGSQTYDELYIVMELLEGQTLKEYLKENRSVPPEQAAVIVRQIAEGLAEVHAQGVVYRDLKPANIMLTHDHQGRLLVKIVDFGAVKLINQTPGLGDIELTGAMFIGSALYASPENCRAKPLDARSDIYCLGLILYEMLAGYRAFDSPDWFVLLNEHAYATPPPLVNVPAPLARLVARSLEKDPKARPQSAADFARLVRDFARPVEPTPYITSATKTASADHIDIAGKSITSQSFFDETENEDETRVAVAVLEDNVEEHVLAGKTIGPGLLDNLAAIAKPTLREGCVVRGTILRLCGDGAVVNLGFNSEGIITWEEMIGDSCGKIVLPVKPGQKIDATVKRTGRKNGFTYLSRPIAPSVARQLAAHARTNAYVAHSKVEKKRPKPVKTIPNGTARTAVAVILVLLLSAFSLVVLVKLWGKPSASHMVINEPESTTPITVPSYKSDIGDELETKTDVNIRDSHSSKGEKIGLAEKGSRVRIMEKYKNWRKVIVMEHGREKEDPDSEDQGWIDGDNLQQIADGA